MQQVWKMASRVEWVHSRAAGLDSLLFSELVDSPVPLTNGRGVDIVLGHVITPQHVSERVSGRLPTRGRPHDTWTA